MDLIDLGRRYLNQIIIIVYEAQVRWYKYIYGPWWLKKKKNPSLFPLKLHMYIHNKVPFTSAAIHNYGFLFFYVAVRGNLQVWFSLALNLGSWNIMASNCSHA